MHRAPPKNSSPAPHSTPGSTRLAFLLASGTTGCLALTLLTSLPACAPSAPIDTPPIGDAICEDDALEDNDSIDTALSAFTVARDTEHVACPGDEDWFYATVQPMWYAELDFAWDPALGELELRVHEEDGSSDYLSTEGVPGVGDGSWSPSWGACPDEDQGIEYTGSTEPATAHFQIVNLSEEPVAYEFFGRSMWACDE